MSKYAIPLMKHTFLHEQETKRALAEFILGADRLSMGKECQEFERKFAKYQRRKHAVLFNSGASANLAMIQALRNLDKLKNEDIAGFSAITWSTNTMPLIQLGLDTVPLDCELQTLNVTSRQILATLEKFELKLLFLTNVLGLTGDLKKIQALCEERNIILLEDNCESLGTEIDGSMAGNFSLGSSFSFFVAHHMSTIEGGMVCTDDDQFCEMIRIVRANGWDRNLEPDQQARWRKEFNIRSEFEASYTFYDLAYNLRPTEITGFLGQSQMQFLDENIILRERNFLRIQNAVRKNDDFFPLQYEHITKVSGFAFPFICKSASLREAYTKRFQDAGIEIRPLIAGNMQKQPFYQKYDQRTYDLAASDHLHNCAFYSGNYPELTEADLQQIERCLTKAG